MKNKVKNCEQLIPHRLKKHANSGKLVSNAEII